MSWLEEALDELRELSRQKALLQESDSGEDHQALAVEFQEGAAEIVRQLGRQRGITAAFACQGESVLEEAGYVPDADGLAKTVRALRAGLDTAAEGFRLGGLTQTVMVGSEHKLALFTAGDTTLGVLTPRGVSLAQAMSLG
jgi:predicted regulator of Ras-like GTPase activity (Roadblock/LC7/MglB family)